MKKYLPWWLKIGLKLMLSRLPINYRFWSKHGLFQHGSMVDPDYAYRIFQQHFERAEFPEKDKGFTCLELGCGDSVSSALIARGFGANQCYLVDTGCFASRNVADYKPLANMLKQNHRPIPFDSAHSFDHMLERSNGIYLTDGLHSLESIPDKSIDFIFSQAVLEHINLYDFDSTMRELKRILKQSGVMSHRVDLKDHLNDSLHNLRFSESVWESSWMSKSGFYTNRIRYTEMLNKFKSIGLTPHVLNIDRWNALPIKKSVMHEIFRHLDESELCIQGFDVLLTHPN